MNSVRQRFPRKIGLLLYTILPLISQAKLLPMVQNVFLFWTGYVTIILFVGLFWLRLPLSLLIIKVNVTGDLPVLIIHQMYTAA